jgi:hypothetical protein
MRPWLRNRFCVTGDVEMELLGSTLEHESPSE